MNAAPTPAGWHPDPSDPSASVRWWDGARWTGHTQLVPADAAPGDVPLSVRWGGMAAAPGSRPYGSPPPGSPPFRGPQFGGPQFGSMTGFLGSGAPPLGSSMGLSGSAPPSFVKRNSMSLAAVGVVALYVAIALSTKIVFFGIFPILLSVRAVRRKEALAPLAIVAAVVAIIVAIVALA
jgi:hypothetical protein